MLLGLRKSCPAAGRGLAWRLFLVHHPSLTPTQPRAGGAAGVLVCAPKLQPGTRVQSNLVTHLLWNESTCGWGYFRRLFSKLLRLPGSPREGTRASEGKQASGRTQAPRAGW